MTRSPEAQAEDAERFVAVKDLEYKHHSSKGDQMNKSAEFISKDVMVAQPPHYKGDHGVECIELTENLNFNIGNALKYLWRMDNKGSHKQDIEKALWYLDREVKRREKSTYTVAYVEHREEMLEKAKRVLIAVKNTNKPLATLLEVFVIANLLQQNHSFLNGTIRLRDLIVSIKQMEGIE